jgi:hypothetical protein
LTNDSGFITIDDIPEVTVPTKVSELENDKGYLTEHQDISHLATKTEINEINSTITDNEFVTANALTNIDNRINSLEEIDFNNFVNKDELPTVPTKVSELTNDSGFITIDDVPVLEIPEEYVTDDELSQKGFLVGEETSEELDDVETNTYVKYVAQTLSDEQKNQVRENLGIPSVDYIISLFEELKTLINNNSTSDAIAVLDKAILDMHKLQ